VSRIGILITESSVTGYLAARTRGARSFTVPIGDSGSADAIGRALGELVAALPPRRLPYRHHANVAVSAPHAWVKRVRGLPPVRGRRELIAMLRLGSTRFFAARTPIVITGATLLEAGEADVGVLDASVGLTISAALARAGLMLDYVIPAAALDGHAAPAVVSERGPAADASSALLARICRVGARTHLALPRRDNPTVTLPPISPLRVVAPAVALALVVMASSAALIQRGRMATARMQSTDQKLAPVADSAAAEARVLAREGRDLQAVASFAHQRVSASLLLGRMATALPSDAALTTLRMDTAGVDIVALAPRSAEIMDALNAVAGVQAPTIVGPVSREIVGTRELEQTTVHFRLAPEAFRGTNTFSAPVDRSP